jgi:hypothetical protein
MKIEFMADGPHGASKWVEYRVRGPIAKQLEMADEISFTHHGNDGVIITTFRRSNGNPTT